MIRYTKFKESKTLRLLGSFRTTAQLLLKDCASHAPAVLAFPFPVNLSFLHLLEFLRIRDKQPVDQAFKRQLFATSYLSMVGKKSGKALLREEGQSKAELGEATILNVFKGWNGPTTTWTSLVGLRSTRSTRRITTRKLYYFPREPS